MGRRGTSTVMRFTCAICEEPTYPGKWGLCTPHLKEFSVTGTYVEFTVTGTYRLPEWVRVFSSEHHRMESRMYHRKEVVFSDIDWEKERRW